MEGPVGGEVFTQNEGLEEPGGVSQVPLGGARFRTALHHHVFRGERTTQCEALPARRNESGQESRRAEFYCC